MTDTEIEVKFTEHGERLKVSEHRIKDLEDQQKEINILTKTVSELAYSMKAMCDELKEQGARLAKLEEVPATNWNNLVKTIVAAVASGLVGFMVANVLR